MNWTRMWTTVVPGCEVEVLHYVEYLQADGTFYGEVPVRSGEDMDKILANLPSRAVGFRLYTCARTAILGPELSAINLVSEPIEVGVTFCVGRPVSREYVDAIRTNPISTGLDLTYLLNRFDATPGAKILEYRLDERTFFRVIPPDDGMTVIIDRAGVPVVAVTGPPEGWAPVTEFEGTEFSVDVNGNVLEVSGRQLDPPVLDATVKLFLNPMPSGMEQRIRNAVKMPCPEMHGAAFDSETDICPVCAGHRSSATCVSRPGIYGVDYREGKVSFSCHDNDPPAAITIQIDDKRALLLSWNGKKLTAVLTAA